MVAEALDHEVLRRFASGNIGRRKLETEANVVRRVSGEDAAVAAQLGNRPKSRANKLSADAFALVCRKYRYRTQRIPLLRSIQCLRWRERNLTHDSALNLSNQRDGQRVLESQPLNQLSLITRCVRFASECRANYFAYSCEVIRMFRANDQVDWHGDDTVQQRIHAPD